MIYRITFGFAGGNTGWGETHAMLNASNNPKDLMPTLTDIAQKRVLMLGGEFSIVAIRAARYATDDGIRKKGVFLQKKTYTNPHAGEPGWGAEPAAVALLAIGSTRPNVLLPQFDANENVTFLGGPVDECVDNAGVVYPGRKLLQSSFDSWKAAVIAASLGWLVSDTIVNDDILLASQNANGTVRITLNGGAPVGVVPGHLYNCRIRGVNNGHSPLNGAILLRASVGGEFNSTKAIAFSTPQVGGAMRVYREVYPFAAYGDLQLEERAGKHQRGRPFGSPRGRIAARIRG